MFCHAFLMTLLPFPFLHSFPLFSVLFLCPLYAFYDCLHKHVQASDLIFSLFPDVLLVRTLYKIVSFGFCMQTYLCSFLGVLHACVIAMFLNWSRHRQLNCRNSWSQLSNKKPFIQSMKHKYTYTSLYFCKYSLIHYEKSIALRILAVSF